MSGKPWFFSSNQTAKWPGQLDTGESQDGYQGVPKNDPKIRDVTDISKDLQTDYFMILHPKFHLQPMERLGGPLTQQTLHL